MAHQADGWIAASWQGKPVEHTSGRMGRVLGTKFDERGALHCRISGDWWYPAVELRIMEEVEVQELARNDSQCDLSYML